MKMNHVVFRIYSDLHYIYNIVRDEDLEEHIANTQESRPMCAVCVDGVIRYKGKLSDEGLLTFENIRKSAKIARNQFATIPYK